ncbi:hypothetical protein [Hansschlegelia zhihuaiae]|uniref:Uncharacterized protein n=1 Tax=Hansschlegelia zhihuaiae TaxID=405005 RepID=A0A4Q0MAH5_9HYPH|nr:hypothetical protein [Hansschlegelia zhihuaiae]RXF70261.1 hypothetical protein EK403_17030 [Hansschlegelia zhihuaiae]
MTTSAAAALTIASGQSARPAAPKPRVVESQLDISIRRHEAAVEELEAAQRAYLEIAEAYDKAYPVEMLPATPWSLGAHISSRMTSEKCKDLVKLDFHQLRGCGDLLARMDPEIGESVRVTLVAKEAEALARVDRLFDDRRSREDAFGLTAAEGRHQTAMEAAFAAGDAVFQCPCRTIDEVRRKARYLISSTAITPGLEYEPEDILKAFLA